MKNAPQAAPETSRSFWVAVLLGAGIMAAVDEIIFHQLLAWHHFYDRSTAEWALFSDGVLHAAELIALVAGFFFLSDLKRRQTLSQRWAWSGFFVGAGGFQLFDGIIDHKVLKVHQIRYGVDNLWVYDLVWNVAALLLILVGLAIGLKARSDQKNTLRR